MVAVQSIDRQLIYTRRLSYFSLISMEIDFSQQVSEGLPNPQKVKIHFVDY